MFFINSTLTASLDHLQYFFPLLAMALLLIVIFAVPALAFRNQKIIPFSILLVSCAYIFTALFVIVTDIFSRLGGSYLVIIPVLFVVLLSLDLFVVLQNKKVIAQIKSYFSKNKSMLLCLALVTLFATFLLSKFVFQNGLHDEWQHHAVVEDMLSKAKLPIRNEYVHLMNISDYYHYGWYYLVILTKTVFLISIETALDVTKLFLFIPVIPLFYTALSRFLPKIAWIESLFFSVVLVFQGPSLFLTDSYSRTVLFGITNPIIYQPLFFQLAGITWYGLVFTCVFSILLYYVMKTKNKYLLLFFILVSFYSIYLLNKAYFFFQVVVFAVLISRQYMSTIKTIFQSKKILLVFLTILLLVVGIFAAKMFFSTVLSMMTQTSNLIFLRSLDTWGFAYEYAEGLKFATLFSKEFVFSFGLVFFLPLLLPVLSRMKVMHSSNIVLYLLYIFSFVVPYVVNFSGSELALNKFYLIVMTVSLLICLVYYQYATQTVKKIFILVAVFSILSPLLYFASAYPVKQQVYWNYSDEIIRLLKNSDETQLLVVYDDKEYAKYLTNNLDIELVHKNRYDRGYSEKIKYLVSDKDYPEYELLAKTDENFLYKLY